MAVRYNQITLTGTDDPSSSVFFIKNHSIFAREIGGNFISSYTGHNNTVYGKYAGQLLKNANNNVILGYGAGYNTNFQSAIFSSDNTFVGTNAGYDNTSGFKNTYIGANSSKTLKRKNTYFNVCVGADSTSEGNYTTSIGPQNKINGANCTNIGYKLENEGEYSHIYGNNIINNGKNSLLIIPNSDDQKKTYTNNLDNYVNIYNLFEGVKGNGISVNESMKFKENADFVGTVTCDTLVANDINFNNLKLDELRLPGAFMSDETNLFELPTTFIDDINVHSNVNVGNRLNAPKINGNEFVLDEWWKLYVIDSEEPELKDLVFKSKNNAAASFSDFFDPTLFNFTGQHRCSSKNISYDDNYNDTLIGKIVCSNGEYSDLNGKQSFNINDAIPIISLSNKKYDNSCFGVISGFEKPDDDERCYQIGNMKFKHVIDKTNKKIIVNSVGEGGIWICNQNGNFKNGDLIVTSDVPGYGMVQSDDVIRTCTVAKITCGCDFEKHTPSFLEFKTIIYNDVTYQSVFVGCIYKC